MDNNDEFRGNVVAVYGCPPRFDHAFISNEENNLKLKELKEKTNASLADCKNALVICHYYTSHAIEYVNKHCNRDNDKLATSADNSYIHSYVHLGKIGVLLQVNCQQAVTTKTQELKDFCDNVCINLAFSEEDLLNQPLLADQTKTVQSSLDELCKNLKEKITITRFVRWTTN
jgi:translation elongation factor EF-Ts